VNRWKALAARIDDMTLRQRGLLFAAVSLLLVALAYVALVDPILLRHKGYIDTVNRNQSQITAVRAQIESILREQVSDPDELALKTLEQEAAEAERALTSRRQGFTAAARLPALVKQLLGQNRPVKLESLKLLPAQQVDARAQLYRHGVEVALSGAYFDLVQYLADLEKVPGKFLWGGAEIQVRQYPEVRLTFQVHTLSPQASLGL
jgi:MSHA biogenesis protein MshJ